jgi:hypothetical protein
MGYKFDSVHISYIHILINVYKVEPGPLMGGRPRLAGLPPRA